MNAMAFRVLTLWVFDPAAREQCQVSLGTMGTGGGGWEQQIASEFMKDGIKNT